MVTSCSTIRPIGIKARKQRQIKIYTISGGRKEAQTLVFAKTKNGCVLEYIDGHFD